MDESPILVDRRAGYRVVTLNRPQRLNSFTEDMHVALKKALGDAQADPACRALMITGAGRGFCAGQDLNDRLAKPGETIVLGVVQATPPSHTKIRPHVSECRLGRWSDRTLRVIPPR